MEKVMAEINKLSVEKTIEKLRGADQRVSRDQRLEAKTDELNEEIRRMRAQRKRLDRRKQD
ncbi:hypothetical protein XH80_11565 [Bradyrhizobium sp. CCBAU 45384]|nr:hypothetical protein [Bradyrhizobium sp. CCBAU 45384]